MRKNISPYFFNRLVIPLLLFLCASGKVQKMSPQIYIRTPLIESAPLREYSAGRRVYLKLENCQPSGSCKLRGIAGQVEYVSRIKILANYMNLLANNFLF